MEKKLKIYLDTSVINFLFADDAPEKKEVTVDFFENYINDYDVYISELVIIEIKRTSNLEKLEKLLNAITKNNLKYYNEINNEILELADNYLKNSIVPYNQIDDARHLAFATFFEFDILLSWNFKHLANINVQRKLYVTNLNLGFNKQLLLYNPMELTYDKQS
jgi:predicted nucleic acid-binding protein